MYAETYEVLENSGYADDQTLADAIAELLEANPINDRGDLGKALTINDIRARLLPGDYEDEVLWELQQHITTLTRPLESVHRAMRNGHVLCSARVKRTRVDENGDSYLARETARFVSSDAQVAEQYRIGGVFRRINAGLARANRMIQADMERIPALRPRVEQMIRESHAAIQKELPLPKDEE